MKRFYFLVYVPENLENADSLKLAKGSERTSSPGTPVLTAAANPAAPEFLEQFKAMFKRASDHMRVNFCDTAGIDSPEKGCNGLFGVTFFDDGAQKNAYVKMVKNGKFTPAPEQTN